MFPNEYHFSKLLQAQKKNELEVKDVPNQSQNAEAKLPAQPQVEAKAQQEVIQSKDMGLLLQEEEVRLQEEEVPTQASDQKQPDGTSDNPIPEIQVVDNFDNLLPRIRNIPKRYRQGKAMHISMAKGIAEYGEAAVKAIEFELRQMVEKKVWTYIETHGKTPRTIRC